MRKVRVRCWIWHKTIEQSVNMSNRSASVWYERRMEFWIGVLLNLDAILFGWMSDECNTSHHLSLHIDFPVTRFCLLDCRYFRHTGKEGRKNFFVCFFTRYHIDISQKIYNRRMLEHSGLPSHAKRQDFRGALRSETREMHWHGWTILGWYDW